MHRLDLIERKYQCISCYDDEMQAFWSDWSELHNLHPSKLTEGEAVKAYAPFIVENTCILIWRDVEQ